MEKRLNIFFFPFSLEALEVLFISALQIIECEPARAQVPRKCWGCWKCPFCTGDVVPGPGHQEYFWFCHWENLHLTFYISLP